MDIQPDYAPDNETPPSLDAQNDSSSLTKDSKIRPGTGIHVTHAPSCQLTRSERNSDRPGETRCWKTPHVETGQLAPNSSWIRRLSPVGRDKSGRVPLGSVSGNDGHAFCVSRRRQETLSAQPLTIPPTNIHNLYSGRQHLSAPSPNCPVHARRLMHQT